MKKDVVFYWHDGVLNDLEYRALHNLSGDECKVLREACCFRPRSKVEDFLGILHKHGMFEEILNYVLEIQQKKGKNSKLYFDVELNALDFNVWHLFSELMYCRTYFSIICFLLSRDGIPMVNKYQLKKHTADEATSVKLSDTWCKHQSNFNALKICTFISLLTSVLLLFVGFSPDSPAPIYNHPFPYMIAPIIAIIFFIWSLFEFKIVKPIILKPRMTTIEAQYRMQSGKETMFIADLNFVCAVLEILTGDKAKLMKIKEKYPANDEYKHLCEAAVEGSMEKDK